MWLKSIQNKYPLYHIYIVKKTHKKTKKQSYFTFYNERDKQEENSKKLSHSKIGIWLTLNSNYYSNQNHTHK